MKNIADWAKNIDMFSTLSFIRSIWKFHANISHNALYQNCTKSLFQKWKILLFEPKNIDLFSALSFMHIHAKLHPLWIII